MKFSSPEYPSYNYSRTNSIRPSKDEFAPKVKIPNYTTSSYNPMPRKTESQKPGNMINNTPGNYNYNNNGRQQYDTSHNPPVVVPLMPLYGYDNNEDAEKDCLYFRQLHPNTAKRILREIDEECDKLEYDGSCMFDEYPDKVYLGRVIDSIYNRTKDVIEEPIVYTENLKSSEECKREKSDVESNSKSSVQEVNRRNRSNRNPIRSNNWLRDLIEILLYQELINRRRRYRSRRRWF